MRNIDFKDLTRQERTVFIDLIISIIDNKKSLQKEEEVEA